MKTVHLRPQAWAYRATEAEVLPVEAQAQDLAPTIMAWLNAAAMPLSLNDPEGFSPSYCRNRLSGFIPRCSAMARFCWRIVCPSPMVTLLLSGQRLSNSRNRHTPEKSSGL